MKKTQRKNTRKKHMKKTQEKKHMKKTHKKNTWKKLKNQNDPTHRLTQQPRMKTETLSKKNFFIKKSLKNT